MTFMTLPDAFEIVSPEQIISRTPALAARRRFDIATEEMTEDQVELVKNLGDDLKALVAKHEDALLIHPEYAFKCLADVYEDIFEGVTSRALVAWMGVV